MFNLEIQELPPQERLPVFLERQMDELCKTPNDLAEHLGYASEAVVVMWILGKAKIPIDRLTSICRFLELDVADIIPHWFAQECPEDVKLVEASKRMLSFWEMQVIYTAREVYGSDRIDT